MQLGHSGPVAQDRLAPGRFEQLRRLIYAECGINLTSDKQAMLEGRIRKRLRSLDLATYSDYCKYLFSEEGRHRETRHFIDAVTTNKTDFFRESRHFDILAQQVLPVILEGQAGPRRPLVFWSAGCSTGEEPYTLAMVLNGYAEKNPGFTFRILATDISTEVLTIASRAIYDAGTVRAIPPALQRKYLLRSRKGGSGLFRVVPELRRLVEFGRINLMEGDFGIREPVDVIFCRNVIIYFDRPTQTALMERFWRQLRPGGFLFLGHSETAGDLEVPLRPVGPTVYRRSDAAISG